MKQEERAILYEHGGTRLMANWRGDTLLRMDPPGQLSPIYRRSLHTEAANARRYRAVKEIDSL